MTANKVVRCAAEDRGRFVLVLAACYCRINLSFDIADVAGIASNRRIRWATTMWHSQVESLNDGRVQKFTVLRDDAPVPYSDVLALWCNNAEFRSFFIALLADSPFTAFRWETPPVTSTNTDRDFEFALLHSTALERSVDPTSFAGHFDDTDVVTFPNLGGDAVMVVPCPVVEDSIYGHLASFIRNAPETQVQRLWQTVGVAMQERVCDRPVWLNTAGMGIPWLHVRLDSQPQYYGYAPFKQLA